MNKIFRLVWNAALNTWGVASELATAKTKSNRLGAPRDATTAAASSVELFIGSVAASGHKKINSVTKLAAAALLFGAGSLNVAYAGNTCLINGTWVTAPTASGDNALACGEKASASEVDDLALGSGANANGAIAPDGHIGGAIAIGKNSKAQMYNAIALGTGAAAYGTETMAIGQGATSGVSGNTSIVKSLALGFSAIASEGYTVAIGSGTKATGYSAVSIGNAPIASGANAVAIGTWTTASGFNSTGIGYLAVANNSRATAIGESAKASGASAIALGTGARAEGTASIGIGDLNVVTGNKSGAIGSGSSVSFSGVSGNSSYSLGNGNVIANNNTFVVGNNITTTQDNSVVLGNNSTDRAVVATPTGIINGTTYNYAGGSPTGVVSVGSVNGERQIINLAAGQVNSTSTDAINGSQLHATNQAIAAVDADAVKYDDGTHNAITLGGTTYDNSTHTGGTRITNVADGKAPNDAVNFSQLTQTNNSITTLGNSLTNLYETGTKYFHANSTGTDSVASGRDAVAIGMGAVASHDGSVALGAGSVADGSTLGHKAYLVSGTATGEVNIGDRRITGLSAGADDADAVNVEQLKAVAAGAAASVADVVKYDDSTHNTITLGGNTYDSSTHTGGTTITNVANGVDDSDAVNMSQLNQTNNQVSNNTTNITSLKNDALLWDTSLGAFSASHGGVTVNKITNVGAGDLSANSTDAVNGSQLYALGRQVTGIDNRVTTIENSFNTINNGGGIKYFRANSSGADSVASGAESIAMGPNAVASGAGSVASGNGANAAGNGAVAVGEGAKASANGSVALGSGASDGGRGAENYTGKYSGADNKTAGTASIGNAATGETRTLSNLADGKEATDAVNLRQLDGAVAESKKYTDDSISSINNSVANQDKRVTDVDNRVTQAVTNVTNLQKGTDGMFQVNNTSNLAKPSATGDDSMAGGAGAKASGKNSSAVGTNAIAAGNNSTAIGNGSTAKADNSVALGANSVADRANSVSVGAAGSERQITHVAAGTAPTDAVNLSQLNKGLADATNNANAYTNSVYNSLNKNIKELDSDLSAGIAGAMAMAALPQPYTAGASMTSGSLGTYRGESAMALGVSRISDNGRWVTKMQATTNTQRDFGASVGVGYQW
ncbi:YadA-like family protein [Pseudomonas sp. OV226]|jgi:autotransporter adhesin|uniref:YadA-like family protein n=1 Tax=Pseudomonas sp. OV226 TaxID=2135588 RepID=UPI000D7B7993|nr:autotransporter adhesin [Pseudomonas sp. OV226]